MASNVKAIELVAVIALLLDDDDEEKETSQSVLNEFDHGCQEEKQMLHFIQYFKN